MSFSIVIPARFASTRLPGKPLLDIAGKPMIQRVYEQACKSRAERIVIATDDDREGEAIGWHICDMFELDVKSTHRIIFHEITKSVGTHVKRSVHPYCLFSLTTN